MAARPDTFKSIESVKHYHLSQLHCAVIEMYYKGLHAHKDVEIILCLSGLLRIITPDEEFDLKPGEVAYFNPNQPHSCETLQVKGSRLLLFQFDPSFCISYYPHMRNLFFPTSQISAAVS